MRKGDVKRGQILDAAERLFYEKGYDRTSIQDLLNALNLSKGGFYHYFDAKEAVLAEVCDRRAEKRYEKLGAELYASRRGPVERLNLLLGLANLFESEDPRYAAMMVKLCYIDKDAALRVRRRQTLLDRLLPHVDVVIAEGLEEGCLHTRYPLQIGRLLMMMACDVDDAACAMLAQEAENPDVVLRILDMLSAYRDSCERLVGAPYGSLELFDVGRLLDAWRAAMILLSQMEENP